MSMNLSQEHWLLGALTAQGYMLEVLLGTQLLAQSRQSPLEALELGRRAIQKQIRFDMRVPPTDNPHADHLAIQRAASTHLDEMFDRIKTQLAPKSAKPGGAD